MENILFKLLLEQIPEAIYFALFLINTKQIKENRILFIVFMIIEYLMLKFCFPFDIKFQLTYTIMSFILLKIFYKDKTQITDIFTFSIASIIMIISCGFLFFIIKATINNYVVYVVLHRILLILFLVLTKNKLYKIENLYKKLWNRNDQVKKKIKSTTFRALNVVIFNLMFYIINIAMMYAIFVRKGGI